MAETVPMPMCPMAETCKGMMEKPLSSFVLVVPGLVLIALGVAVVVEPRILVWLVAVALILTGFAMLGMAKFMRRIGKRFHQAG
jgi:Flp pilus assembly protein TadB